MEENNSHLTRLKGKIIRNENCPLGKLILCENCEFYDGWGIDVEDGKAHIYCTNENIVDANRLNITLEKENKKIKKKKKNR